MWITRLKLMHKDCPIVTRAVKYNVPVLSYPSTWYERKGKKYVTTTCFFVGDAVDKEKFWNNLKKDKRIKRLERSSDIFSYECELSAHGEHVQLYHTKQLIFAKPVYNSPDGHEYWEIASWDKKVLFDFISLLKKHMDVCEVMKMVNEPLTDVYFPHVAPQLSKGQKAALTLALKEGYYTCPRKKSLKDLAKIAKVSLQTFQEHLRKAESKVMPGFLPSA